MNFRPFSHYLSRLQPVSPSRYFRSIAWVASTKVLGITVSFIATLYIARTLGPQNFGEISYALSIIGILGFLAAFASGNVVYRDLIRSSEREPILLGTAWTISFIAAVGTSLLAASFVFFFPHNQLTTYVIGILCLTQFFSPFQVIQHTFYARAHTKSLSIGQFALHASISFAKILVMVSGQGVLVLACIMLAEQVLGALMLSTLYWRATGRVPLDWRFDGAYAKKLIHDSIPFVVIASSAAISARIDQVLLKQFLDTTTVGLYQAATQLSEVWQFVPGLLLATLYPALVNAKVAATDTYRARLFAFGGLLLLYGVVAATLTALVAPVLIPLLYGEAFVASIPILQIYAWSIIGTVLSIFIVHFLVAENLRSIQIITGIIPMVVNLFLNLWWIPLYGAQGAAWATVISYSLAPIIPFFFTRARKI